MNVLMVFQFLLRFLLPFPIGLVVFELYYIFISFARFSTHLSSFILALMCVVHLQASIGLKCLVGAVFVILNFLMVSIIVFELA